jgi:hypothetical protein
LEEGAPMSKVTMVDGEPMLQVLVLTIDGKQYACLGPVLHVPPVGLEVGDIEEIEFGEIIPANAAVSLFCGSGERLQ